MVDVERFQMFGGALVLLFTKVGCVTLLRSHY